MEMGRHVMLDTRRLCFDSCGYWRPFDGFVPGAIFVKMFGGVVGLPLEEEM